MPIDPDTYYSPTSPEMQEIAAPQTLARWRHEGRGSPYTKVNGGSRVLYFGRDVLDWLEAHRIETADTNEAA